MQAGIHCVSEKEKDVRRTIELSIPQAAEQRILRKLEDAELVIYMSVSRPALRVYLAPNL